MSDKGPLLLKVGLPLLVAIGLAVVDPQATRAVLQATVSSPQAILIVLGVIAAIVGWAALARRFVPNPWAQAGAVLVPLAVIGAIWVAPYYQEGEVVDDAFPVALAAPTSSANPTAATDPPATDPAPTPTDTTSIAAATADQPPSADPTDIDGDAPASAAAQAPPAASTPTPTPTPTPAGPVELSRGTFVGLDGHFAHGQAAVYDLGDGTQLIRFEEVDLQNVPAPVVYAVPTADATAPTESSIDLGVLKGTQGNQNYEVPAEVDLASGEWTVLVWCETFASPVGAASQA